MSVSDNIFTNCRKGDLGRVKYLVEQKEQDLNVRDNWDSTPLYYACLCGHIDLVRYLLENGAKCEANTFDGERCLYGALTNDVRKLLLEAKVITAQTKRRDDFDIFCDRLLNANEFSDITFLMDGTNTFNVHRCILSVRSEYFKNRLQTRWKDRREVRNSMIDSSVFEEFLKYIYTGRIVCPRDRLKLFFRLADQCEMPQLRTELDQALVKADSFERSKKGVRVSTIAVESEKSVWELQQAYGQLLEQGLPPEFSAWPAANELPLMPVLPSAYFDLCLLVEGYRFYCHRLFVCIRSGYFNGLVQNHFHEAYLQGDIPVMKLVDVDPAVIACVLYYIYTNNAQLTEETVLDVLRTADMYLLPGLKRQCGVFLSNRVDLESVMMMFKLARLYDLPRLENRCTEFIASNIERLQHDEELHEAVLADASEVKGRQDTDTIEIIDEIRYHITCGVQTYSEVEDANDKLKIIDTMLENLGLEA